MIPSAIKAGVATAGLCLGLLACTNGGLYQLQDGGAGAGATGRSASASGSTGGSGTSGGSSTSGGQQSCNPYADNCPGFGSVDPLAACSDGQLELVANLVQFNFQSGTQPITCQIVLTDFFNPGLSVKTDLCGYIRYCVAAGTQVSFTAHVSGFVDVNFATLVVNQSVQIPDRPGIPMVKSTIIESINQVLPGADTSQAMVIVNVQPLDLQSCDDKSGWTLGLVDGQGNSVDAGVAYVISSTPDPAASATDISGIVFFYNIDPTLGVVQPRGFKAGNALADGGVICANPENGPPFGFTGSVPLEGGDVSVIPFVVAPSQ